MNLPKLKVLQAFKEPTACKGLEGCKTCHLFKENGGRCSGCSTQKQQTFKETGVFDACLGGCHTCAGYKVDYTAICCRSPLKDIYFTALTKGKRGKERKNAQWNFTKRPLLKFKDKAVFMISSGGVNTIAPGDMKLVENHEVVAVNITRVWGSNGFYSKDLKDYLHLPKKTKLILLTMCLDDLLERAWKTEMYTEPEAFEKVGIDHWMPLAFSAYPEDANMHAYYQFLRTSMATEKSKSWWYSGDHYQIALQMDDLFKKGVEKIPQVMFNAQFLTTEAALRFNMRLFKHWHEIAPPETAFWFVGASTPSFFHNVRKLCGTRDLYFISPKMLYLASKGQAMTINGGSEPSDLSKHDLLQKNCNTFSRMVAKYAGVKP